MQGEREIDPTVRDQISRQLDEQFNKTVEQYSKRQVLVREYCELGQKALGAPITYLHSVAENSKKITAIAQKGNYNNLVKLLCHPNVLYNHKEKVNTQKSDAEIKDTGRRIISMIAYAWDYYIRLIEGFLTKGTGNGVLPGVYTQTSVKLAGSKIAAMLQEMKKKNYHWENFVKDVMANQEQEEKEIEEQETFIKLLQNLLMSQTEKVLKARKQGLTPIEGNERELMREEQEKKVEHMAVMVEQKKLNIQSLIDVKSYFERKKQRQGLKQTHKQDPISRCEQNRRFNASVLRYCMNTQIS